MFEPQKKSMRLQTRFLFGLAAILVAFATFAAISVYYFQVKSFEYSAYRKANLVMIAMDASRRYVREVLRPKMYDNLEVGDFIIEAMSSSYISREIAERLEKSDTTVHYRRVAVNARNENYEANSQEQAMITYFQENPDEVEWHDVVELENGGEQFMKFKPVLMENSCLYCHGKTADAPQKVVEIYGEERGFGRKVGDVIGVVSVALPIDMNIYRAKEIAITAFMAVVPAIVFLYAIISVFFNQVVSSNLRNVLNAFRKILRDERGQQLFLKSQALDEVGTLNEVAEKIADHLQNNHNVLERYAHELYHSKELLQSVFDGIADPVVLINQVGDLHLVNKAFLRLHPIEKGESIAKNIYSVEKEGDNPISLCRELIESIGDDPLTREFKLANGKMYQVYLYPVNHGEFMRHNIVCYVKDMTDEKRMEERIQHTEKILSMGQVAAGVAHEINNPLGVILCHIDFIRDEENLSEESRSDLAIIEKHVDNCRRIISDLLRFSRPSPETRELYGLNDIVLEVLGMLGGQLEKSNISIESDFAEDLPDIYFDVDRFKQVILNLVLNSSQAIGSDGTIIVRTLRKNKNLLIEVEDTGSGIPEDSVEKIFEPFFTTKAPGEGTGLGLAVSYGIIRNHNGIIRLKEKSENTCFIITIPIEENCHE